ncbi:hypothetical protein CAPTEDRAFT_205721 [Capitella teleta]|uniref:Uncharacterized protein n=1 Tax=Capitella teleta TaxID=283909 RepID=R7TT44_CAPTE|nr:hypothetical protein CAPTEDRAFT_205721 [Capitella teleta]|eukprot:ELT97063.1 hypothetical protein CAPTEDRAFT_205721 [Capitella teleta]
MEESLQEFASRVQQLARDAHPSLVTEALEPMAVDAFLRGCKEKLAAYSALNREPATVELAVNLVEGAVTNQQAIFGSTVPVSKLRQVLRFENPTQTQPDDYQVRAVHASSVEGLEAATEKRFRQCEGALVEVKAGMSSLGEQMKEVMSLGFFQAKVQTDGSNDDDDSMMMQGDQAKAQQVSVFALATPGDDEMITIFMMIMI